MRHGVVEHGAPWRAACASVPGRHKRAEGHCGEDAVRTAHLRGGVVLAVADGAGSSARAADAASLAVASAVAAVHGAWPFAPQGRPGWRRLLDSVAAETVQRFTAAALALERSERLAGSELQTTLAVAVAGADGRIGLLRIGDAFAVVRRAGRAHLVLSPQPTGEHAGQTALLAPDRGGERDLEVLLVDDPSADAVILSTDGLSAFAVGRRAGVHVDPSPDLVTWACAQAERGDTTAMHETLLLSSKIAATTGDDLTLAVAVRR